MGTRNEATTAEPLSQDKLEAVRMALQMGYPLNADTRAALLRLLAEHRERGKRIAELESEVRVLRAVYKIVDDGDCCESADPNCETHFTAACLAALNAVAKFDAARASASGTGGGGNG